MEYDLPNDFFSTYVPRIKAVNGEDVFRVAKKYLDLDHLVIVIVADRLKVESAPSAIAGGQGHGDCPVRRKLSPYAGKCQPRILT